MDVGSWYRHVNQVAPSLIRVQADELTYGLHVILRFELENDLIDDKINVSEAPKLWNEKMKEMLDITPPTDKEGVLQDMHWSGGSFGYFPTYAIVTIYASQLFKKITEENPNVINEIEKGEFRNILSWLREHVHKYGFDFGWPPAHRCLATRTALKPPLASRGRDRGRLYRLCPPHAR